MKGDSLVLSVEPVFCECQLGGGMAMSLTEIPPGMTPSSRCSLSLYLIEITTVQKVEERWDSEAGLARIAHYSHPNLMRRASVLEPGGRNIVSPRISSLCTSAK